ncbi:MAG: hypothetical protein IJA34_00685 [Lachnospiraceae bacterium]|nr:hypothetical protein [Lachnospiraceae bacterium]
MKLNDVLKVISNKTTIHIYADNKEIFCGYMAYIKRDDFMSKVGNYLNNKVYRINTVNDVIIIVC